MPKPWRQVLLTGVPLAALFWAAFDAGLYVGLRPAAPPVTAPVPAVPVGPTKAEAALDRVLPKVDFEGTPLNRALEAVGKLAGTPVVLRYNRFATPNVALVNCETPVTLHARDVTAGQVIRDLTGRDVSTHDDPRWYERLAYVPGGDVIIVSTWRDLVASGALTRAFEVGDLTGPDRPPEALARLVRANVAPGSWDWPGSLEGSVRCVGGRLVVTQDWHVLRETDRFLAGLRRAGQPSLASP